MSQRDTSKVRLLSMLCEPEERENFRRTQFTVADVMTTPALTASTSQSVHHALSLMTTNRARHVIITEGQKAVGIISDRDMARVVWTEKKDLFRALKSEIKQDLQTVSSEASVIDAAATMLTARISSLPVVRADGVPVGIVTSTDLLWLLKALLIASADDAKTMAHGLVEEIKGFAAEGRLSEQEAHQLISKLLASAKNEPASAEPCP